MLLATTVLLLTASAPSAPVTSDAWIPLIDRGEIRKAKKTCEAWLKSPVALTRAEGHKCLANVELGAPGASVLRLDGDAGGGVLGQGYEIRAARRAVKHLDEALALSPQDLSIHQGRLHILESAGLDADMAKALAESAATYRGADAFDAWLAYPGELFELRRFESAVALLKVLDARYPDDHRIAGNLSAAHAMLERYREALEWALKAVRLAPDDPIDTWNLARIYDVTAQLDLAEATYLRSLKLQPPERRTETSCMYAEFVEQKRKDPKRACDLQKASRCEQTACRAP